MSNTSNTKENENENCYVLFFCFRIDKKIQNGNFGFGENNFNYETEYNDNLCILKVFVEKKGWLSSGKIEFKIVYKIIETIAQSKQFKIKMKSNKKFSFSVTLATMKLLIK